MTTLREYVAGQFPQHEIDVWETANPDDLSLSSNTVVSYAVGTRDGLDLLNTVKQSAPNARVAALAVRPTDPTVVPTDDEDPDSDVDVPVQRVIVSAAIGAVILGVLFTWMADRITGSIPTAIIVGVFTACIGAAIGAIVGGGRFAGDRSTTQPHAPGRRITVVAAFLDDEGTATSLAKRIGPAADYDVRIVNQEGGWHSPAT